MGGGWDRERKGRRREGGREMKRGWKGREEENEVREG